jgi:hypothetical protein
VRIAISRKYGSNRNCAISDDTEKANVYLGLGVYMEMPIQDASVYLGKRKEMLHQKRLVLIEKANLIKANIKLVYEVRDLILCLIVVLRLILSFNGLITFFFPPSTHTQGLRELQNIPVTPAT